MENSLHVMELPLLAWLKLLPLGQVVPEEVQLPTEGKMLIPPPLPPPQLIFLTAGHSKASVTAAIH